MSTNRLNRSALIGAFLAALAVPVFGLLGRAQGTLNLGYCCVHAYVQYAKPPGDCNTIYGIQPACAFSGGYPSTCTPNADCPGCDPGKTYTDTPIPGFCLGPSDYACLDRGAMASLTTTSYQPKCQPAGPYLCSCVLKAGKLTTLLYWDCIGDSCTPGK